MLRMLLPSRFMMPKRRPKPPCSPNLLLMSDASPDASLIADDSFTETSAKGLTYPWGSFAPGAGKTHRIANGISWARIPMPGSLGHINTWLLDDGDGVAAVDTGLQLSLCSDAWKALFAGDLAKRPLSRVVCTHLHPDHIGLAGWLAKKFGVELWMSRGEWLTARMLTTDTHDDVPEEFCQMQRAAGWSVAQLDGYKAKGWGRFRTVVFPMPVSYRRMQDGEILDFGPHQWRVIVGSGHSPEHACLWNEHEGVLVAGDQVLPRISSNVSVNITEPEGDPLGDWLNSIDRFLDVLPGDLLVCPAHGEPFKGVHQRLRALRDEHLGRLDALSVFLAEPRRAVDCFSILFNRTIGDEHLDLATGEAVAHLRRLERDGRAKWDLIDGVKYYTAA
jgi:glyoxylase-like metal-dependent hydrolase (beta-lactamase superfamily II)